jgi:hypothetical protein
LCGTVQAIPRTRDAWLRSFRPPGQRLSTPVHEFDARLLRTERRLFEDEDDDEDEDEGE